jgi:hypothetical protein
MDSRTIFLRIGERDRVPLSDFIESLRNFLGMLRDFDATISKHEKGSLIWEVVSLKQNSPPIVGVSPTPRRGMMDYSRNIESQVLQSTADITRTGERAIAMSDSALARLERLAFRTKTIGRHSIFITDNGQRSQETEINERTLRNVQEFTSPKFSSYGSLVGKLEAITVHLANEFRIWDEATGKPVRCKFRIEQDKLVRELLRTKVRVSGQILSNSTGVPISLELDELAPVGERRLPTIGEMSGLVTDFTEGKPLKKYLEEISDE